MKNLKLLTLATLICAFAIKAQIGISRINLWMKNRMSAVSESGSYYSFALYQELQK